MSDCEWGYVLEKRDIRLTCCSPCSALPHSSSVARPSRETVNHTWYDHYYGGHDSYLAVLFPNPFYPGPWNVPRSWTVPVGIEDCGHIQEICNGQLKPGFQYR